MPTAALRAQLSDHDLTQREQHRPHARRGLPDPAATARAIALAICEVEAGLRSASQLERVCHHSLWQAVADRVQRAGGPPVSATSVLRIQVQELTPGLADARWRWSAAVARAALSGALDLRGPLQQS
jgi:hypothetical protein